LMDPVESELVRTLKSQTKQAVELMQEAQGQADEALNLAEKFAIDAARWRWISGRETHFIGGDGIWALQWYDGSEWDETRGHATPESAVDEAMG